MIKVVFSLLLAFIYSAIYTVLGPIIASQNAGAYQFQFASLLLCFLGCFVVNLLFFMVVPKLPFLKNDTDRSSQIKFLDKPVAFPIVWAFIFLSWLPALLHFYPAILSYDTISQTNSALGTIETNHHPVMHTWLIRVFMQLGKNLFSSYEAGLAIMSLLQMIILSYALTRLVFLMKKKNVPMLLTGLTLLGSAFWFTNACLAVTVVKDTLHAAFLILFACHFTEIAIDPASYIKQKRNLISFPVISFLMCAFRNNGIHIYIFCFLLLAVIRLPLLKRIKRYTVLLLVLILPVISFKLYSGPFFSALGIAPGEIREALCIPIQQLQRVAILHEEELTSDQTYLMDWYIDNLSWRDPTKTTSNRAYNPFFADLAKSSFYSAHYNEDPAAFWKFYLQTGLQFPKEYIAAFLANTLGFWYPGYYGYSYVMYDNYPPEMFIVPLERQSLLNVSIVRTWYQSMCSSTFLRDCPVLRLFFVPGFSLWILFYLVMYSIFNKKKFFTGTLPLFLPLIAQFGIMLLSPMSSFRYSWPLYLMLPFALIAIWGNTEPENTLSTQEE